MEAAKRSATHRSDESAKRRVRPPSAAAPTAAKDDDAPPGPPPPQLVAELEASRRDNEQLTAEIERLQAERHAALQLANELVRRHWEALAPAGVRVLLAAGTDPDAVDGRGRTVLYLAVDNDHEEAVGALAEGGADLDKANTFNGATPLMEAAHNGHSGVVRRLLELGADHTAVDYGGKTALEVAEAKGEEEAAAVLREWAEAHHS